MNWYLIASYFIQDHLSYLDYYHQQYSIQASASTYGGPDNKLGKTDILEHEIKVEPQAKPVRMRAYRMGPKQREMMDKMTDELMRQDVIEHSTSPWAAPCFLVAKKGANRIAPSPTIVV